MLYVVPYLRLFWFVDIQRGPLTGVEFAEVELQQVDEFVPMPPWAGEVITNDPRFSKENLLRRCAGFCQLSGQPI